MGVLDDIIGTGDLGGFLDPDTSVYDEEDRTYNFEDMDDEENMAFDNGDKNDFVKEIEASVLDKVEDTITNRVLQTVDEPLADLAKKVVKLETLNGSGEGFTDLIEQVKTTSEQVSELIDQVNSMSPDAKSSGVVTPDILKRIENTEQDIKFLQETQSDIRRSIEELKSVMKDFMVALNSVNDYVATVASEVSV